MRSAASPADCGQQSLCRGALLRALWCGHLTLMQFMLWRSVTFWEERPLPRPFLGSSSSASSSELSSEYSSRRATFRRLGACCAAGAGRAAGSGGYART